ncbi:MAG TPA: recombinase family protein, partial [Candidatus Nitrosocosmicus sp.]|nr:recombinase family protein [Candidatus Nitrosocosmicus sp.]
MASHSTAALYIRVSTEEQATEGQSVDAQIDILTQYCKLYQIKIYQIYKDLGISGKDAKSRPGLIKMLQDARQNKFSMVLVWKISRLSRSLRDLLWILDELDKQQIVFSSYSEKFDTSTPVGKMTLQLLGSIAEFERNTIVDNVKLGLQEYAKKGGKTGTVLGYDNVNKQLIINQTEAEAVKLIYKLYTINQMSMSQIAEHMNVLGFRTKRSNKFNKDSIAVILSNPVYIGVNRHKIGQEDEYCTAGSQLQIIDADTWDAAQRLRDANKTKRPPRGITPFLLSGKVQCPLCSCFMYGFTSHAGSKAYRYYRCKSCGTTSNAEKINDAVLVRLKKLLLNEEIIKHVLSVASQKKINSAEGSILVLQNKELQRSKNMMDRYIMLLNQTEFSSSSVILDKIKDLEAKIMELQELIHIEQNVVRSIDSCTFSKE